MRLTITVALLSVGLWIGSVEPVAAQSNEPVSVRLERIRAFMENGSASQRSASLRQLREELALEDLDGLRAYLAGRALKQETLRHFQRRYEELLGQQLDDAESRVIAFVEGRRSVAETLERLDSLSAGPATDEDVDPAVQLEELRVELIDRRDRREEERQKSHAAFDALLSQGIPLAPLLWRRLDSGQDELTGAASYHVDRLRNRLREEILREARWQFPKAPLAGSLPPFVARGLVPISNELAVHDPEGWETFRRGVADRAISLFETYRQEDRREARSIFLELGEWGRARLAAWVEDDASPVPRRLRDTIHAWNELAVPAGFPDRTGIAIASYHQLGQEERAQMIHRLEWVGGRDVVPILARLLETEPDVRLRVAAAAVLARHDRRGAEYLQRVGYEGAAELETISRQVLLRDARLKRDSGDFAGARSQLERILRRFPADFDVHYELAMTALLAHDFEASINHFRKAIEYDPDQQLAYYNLACAEALAGRSNDALRSLRRAIETGFSDPDHLANDPDLTSLRTRPEFRALIERLQKGR